ncbi:D-2-hydroxyacid dehydrogenase family protein [Siculibacillus lacustris]|uniref:D-2-hydroxyacid dehydrogenase family protein n=1 Tax=Siculibacillus lacustris TaxID=1549641 RepID=A0A4Q9VY00_9HYPH|nr:D-2-hydroxyacid dehydrogenase family protein [Siculibacillus lacustris]TBW41377.1 D-2-hydroxyacid dehydrogenase family protein [Siculibacillus lacustris]
MKIALLDDPLDAARTSADWERLGPDAEIVVFERPFADRAAVLAALGGFEVIVAMRERTPLDAETIAGLGALRLIVTTGMRNAAIDLAAARARGIPVCGTEMFPSPTAELAWGLILALARRLPEQQASLRRGTWQSALGTMLAGKRLGLVGLGKLGSRMARIGAAFEMEPVAWSPNLTDERAAAGGARRVDKAELFATSDVISLHLVLSERSRGVVGAAEIGAMKPSAYLVNTSRAGLVDAEALGAALRAGTIAGAGLDVFAGEPLPPDDPVLGWPNTVLTPHLGYVTAETWRLTYGQALEDIEAWAAGTLLRRID